MQFLMHKDAFPLPDIRQVPDSLRGTQYMITLDLQSGYWQLGTTDRARECSAFCCRRGLFEFTRMPFGLSGVPASFSRAMQLILRDELWKICLCYLDDIIIFAQTKAELLQRFRVVLNRLRDAGMKLKPNKCCLFQTQLQYLGHLVSAKGVEPLPDKLNAIKDFPGPQCVHDVRAFFGLRKQLFDANHSGLLAAHLGSLKMLKELKHSYFWPGMRRDVDAWCRECETCTKGKGPPSKRHRTLQKVLTGTPLDIVAIDILSGLPATSDGRKYILVATDYFTKWSERLMPYLTPKLAPA